jgi:hypothetical protein
MRIDGRKKTKRKSKIWGGALTGEIVQALAGVYLSQTLIRIKDALGLMPLCLRHDEAVYSIPEDKVQASLDIIKGGILPCSCVAGGMPSGC